MTRTDLWSVTDKDRNKTIEAGVMILRLLKFILVTVGKWKSSDGNYIYMKQFV